MSGSLHWSPTSIGKRFSSSGGIREVFISIFGAFPISLDESHLAELRAMRLSNANNAAAISELEDAIHMHKTIQITEKF